MKGRRVVLLTACVAVAVVAVAAVVARHRIVEEWYLYWLDHGDAKDSEDAAKQLGKMGSVRAVPRLIEIIRKRTENDLIHIMPEPDLESLLKVAIASNFDGCARSLVSIAKAKPKESMVHLRATAEQSIYTSLLCENILKEIGFDSQTGLPLKYDSAQSIDELKSFLTSADLKARHDALFLIKQLGPRASGTAPLLIPLLIDTDQTTTFLADYALTSMGERAVPMLTAALKDGRVELRRAAASILRDIGRDAKESVMALEGARNDPDPDVRKQAEHALQRIEDTMSGETIRAAGKR